MGGTVALAAVLFLLVPGFLDDEEPTGPENGADPDTPGTPGLVPPEAVEPPDSPEAVQSPIPPGQRIPRDPRMPGVGEDEPSARRFATTQKRVADLGAAIAAKDAYEGDSDEERDALQRRYQEHTEKLRGQVAASVDHARFLMELMDATEDEELAIRLARILRSVEDESFVSFMADRVSAGEKPIHRRTAILTLENRDADVWQAPVTRAYREDPAPAVRDEASGLLSRSLVDRRYVTKHRELRATFVASLDSKDPTERVRGLDALLADRTADAATVARVRALTKDPDDGVRKSALRTLRVLEPRLAR